MRDNSIHGFVMWVGVEANNAGQTPTMEMFGPEGAIYVEKNNSDSFLRCFQSLFEQVLEAKSQTTGSFAT